MLVLIVARRFSAAKSGEVGRFEAVVPFAVSISDNLSRFES